MFPTLLTMLLSLSAVKPHFGGQVGLQSSTLVGSDATDDGSFYGFYIGKAGNLTSYAMGAYAALDGDWIGVRLSGLYSKQGWTRTRDGEDWEVEMNFFQIPLEVKVLLANPAATVRPYVLGGMYTANLLSNHRSDYDVSDEDVWNTSATGFSIGAGIQTERAPLCFAAQVRLRRDFTPNLSDKLETYNQSIGLDLLMGI